MVQPILQLNNVRKYYPIKKGVFSKTVGHVKAVDEISLDIYPGETIGLVGESGCGKSTLGRSIVKLESITEGSILFEGQDISKLSPSMMRSLRSEIQMIFQDPFSSLNPRKRVRDMLEEPLKVHTNLSEEEIDEKVSTLIELVGLNQDQLDKYPHEFSGGQRQRIGIARALILNPKLIICDEPVSALDVSIQAQILNLLKELQKQFGLTYLFIAHGLGAVKYMSDRIAVMYLGKIVEFGTKEEIFNNPKHPYTKALLDAYPPPNPRLRNQQKIVLEGDLPSPANPPSGCSFHTRCPFKTQMCVEVSPELSEYSHSVACHFPQN